MRALTNLVQMMIIRFKCQSGYQPIVDYQISSDHIIKTQNPNNKSFDLEIKTPSTNITDINKDMNMNDTQMVTLEDMNGSSNDNEDTIETIGAMLDIAEQFGHGIAINNINGAHNTIPLPIKMLPHSDGLSMPSHQSKLASGFDVYAAIDKPIFLNSIGASAVIPTGIAIAVPAGFEAQVRPRSGLAAKHGITVTNTPGTIDADYRGEIKVLLTNLSGRRFKVERGMRIAQIVICPVFQADLIQVDDLNQTDRGEGGFGSTGV